MGAIVIVLALLLSLLAGAFSVAPAQAASINKSPKSVKFVQNSAESINYKVPMAKAPIDTDGDGIVNNEDPDIDNDGVVNANDDDIDGDGILNSGDGDPAATNGYDTNPPAKPGSFTFAELTETGTLGWLFAGLTLGLISTGVLLRKKLQNPGKKPKKNL